MSMADKHHTPPNAIADDESNPGSDSSVVPPIEHQFDDASEDTDIADSHDASRTLPVTSPLEALALACVAEKNQQTALGEDVGPNGEAFQISQNDVLCGRGGLTNHHPGNIFFRRLVRIKQESYLLASKREKAGVAREIVELIRSLSPPGRFLKKDTKQAGVWIEIGDRKAREKTSQALREGAPELREELQTVDQGDILPPGVSEGQRAAILNSMQQQQQPNHHPRTFLQSPENASFSRHWMDRNEQAAVLANRARVVSDDSGINMLAGYHPLPRHAPSSLQQGLRHPHLIIDNTPGTKRKMDETTSCSMQEQMLHGEDEQEQGAKRGPRLKVLKSRFMEYCI